ncbi:MAG: hypothetical protein MI746_07740 [Pseudomonadales bacterium]|nr:hypothetical protein [Pseudomonadales bacterium]
MISPIDLFTLAFLSTAGLYGAMLAYFNGLVGSKRSNTRIMWNSEPIAWFLALVLALVVGFQILGPRIGLIGEGHGYLAGVGILLVIFVYLIYKLSRHTLPNKAFWGVIALVLVASLYAVINIVLVFASSAFRLSMYVDALATMLELMSLVLVLILLFNLLQSVWISYFKLRYVSADSPQRHVASAVAVKAAGEVTNLDALLSGVGSDSTSDSESQHVTLAAGSSIIVDFGLRRIEDHGFKADLRVQSENASQQLSVEVSNDGVTWLACFQDESIASDWDVPYPESPWRFVKIRNLSDQPTTVAGVFDLD